MHLIVPIVHFIFENVLKLIAETYIIFCGRYFILISDKNECHVISATEITKKYCFI